MQAFSVGCHLLSCATSAIARSQDRTCQIAPRQQLMASCTEKPFPTRQVYVDSGLLQE